MIREFSIGVSKTINLGNFQSIRVEATITVAVADGDNFGVLKMQAQSDLKALLEETYKIQRKNEVQQ